MAQISPAQPVVQGLVVVIALVVAQQIGRMLQLDHAGGVLSVASLATVVLMAAGLGLGISARWQLKPVYWLRVVGLCMLITNSPLPPDPSAAETFRMALVLMASGTVASLLQTQLLSLAGRTADAYPFAVAHGWRRSWAHGLMLAAATLVTTPIALAHHWHTSGLWLILTPFLVLQPFVRESWKVALHRSLGTLAGVPLQLPAIAAAVLTVVIAIRRGHRALMLTTLTATIVLINGCWLLLWASPSRCS